VQFKYHPLNKLVCGNDKVVKDNTNSDTVAPYR